MMIFDLVARTCTGQEARVRFDVKVGCYEKQPRQLKANVSCTDCISPFRNRTYDRTIQTLFSPLPSQNCSDEYPGQLCAWKQDSTVSSCFNKFSFEKCLGILKAISGAKAEDNFKLVIPSVKYLDSPSYLFNWSFLRNMRFKTDIPGCFAETYRLCHDRSC